jgi:hypothetical protein
MKAARDGVPAMPLKSYWWAREMDEITVTHADKSGFEGGGEEGGGVFGQIAKVYRSVAEDTVGEEKMEKRERGRTLEDVAVAMRDGLLAKKYPAGN